MSFSSFLLGWDIVKFQFCILSFQASCTLILHLTDVNPGPEYTQIFPFVPCKPFFFNALHCVDTLGGKLVSISFISQMGSLEAERD